MDHHLLKYLMEMLGCNSVLHGEQIALKLQKFTIP